MLTAGRESPSLACTVPLNHSFVSHDYVTLKHCPASKLHYPLCDKQVRPTNPDGWRQGHFKSIQILRWSQAQQAGWAGWRGSSGHFQAAAPLGPAKQIC